MFVEEFQVEQGRPRHKLREVTIEEKRPAKRSKKETKSHLAKDVCHWWFLLSSPVLQKISCPQT